RFEPELSLGDDGFARGHSLINDDVFADPLTDRDRALLDGRILFDDEDELAVLAGLHRLRGHDRRVWLRRQPQADASELSGPQAAVGVLKRAFQLDRVGRHIHRVVDEGQLTHHRLSCVVMWSLYYRSTVRW